MPDYHTPPSKPEPTAREALNAEHREQLATGAARRALAQRDISALYRLLTHTGVSQQQIARLTGQRPSEVTEILQGRQVMAYDVLLRIASALDVPRGWMGLAYDAKEGDADEGAESATPATGKDVVDDEMRRRAAMFAIATTALLGSPVLGEVLELPTPP